MDNLWDFKQLFMQQIRFEYAAMGNLSLEQIEMIWQICHTKILLDIQEHPPERIKNSKMASPKPKKNKK